MAILSTFLFKYISIFGSFGVRSGSVRDPFGVHSGSVLVAFGFHSGSVRDPKTHVNYWELTVIVNATLRMDVAGATFMAAGGSAPVHC